MGDPEMHIEASEPTPAVGWRVVDIVLAVGLGLAAGIALVVPLVLVLDAWGVDVAEPAAATTATALVYAAIFGSVYLLVIRRRSVGFRDIGLESVKPSTIALMVPVTLLMQIVVALVILGSAPLLGDPPSGEEQLVLEENVRISNLEGLILLLGAAVVAPFVEELVFRGLIFRYVRAKRGVTTAVVLSSALFAIVHLAVPLMPALFVLGVSLALVAERYGSIYPSIALHGLHNGIAVVAVVWAGLG